MVSFGAREMCGIKLIICAFENGGERTALKRFARFDGVWQSRQRLECASFSAAFANPNGLNSAAVPTRPRNIRASRRRFS